MKTIRDQGFHRIYKSLYGQQKSDDKVRGDIIEFIKDNPNPTDDQVHDWCEEEGYDVDKIEQYIYELATLYVIFLTTGRANEVGIGLDEVDPKELAMGVEVEYEHTDDMETSRRISLDHLNEIPDYYTRLKKMEEEGLKALGETEED